MPIGKTYVKIATTTISSASSAVTFSNLPQNYTDLYLVLSVRANSAPTSFGTGIRFNGDTGTNYSFTNLRGDGAVAASSLQSNYSWLPLTDDVVAGGSTTIPTLGTMDIFSYAGSTNKTELQTVSQDLNGSGTVQRAVGLWRNTAAITSITTFITSGASWYFGNGSTITLYGIKAA